MQQIIDIHGKEVEVSGIDIRPYKDGEEMSVRVRGEWSDLSEEEKSQQLQVSDIEMSPVTREKWQRCLILSEALAMQKKMALSTTLDALLGDAEKRWWDAVGRFDETPLEDGETTRAVTGASGKALLRDGETGSETL